MSILPAKTQDLIDFCSAHSKVWAAAPTSMGLTAAQVSAFSAKLGNANTSLADQQSAADAARAATTAAHTNVSGLRKSAADLLKLIKAYAETQTNPNTVYAAAQIPPPGQGSPTPPPGKPTDLVVTLLEDGSLGLAWKCPNPAGTQGTIYEVLRKVGGGTGNFAYVGSTGVRKFTDDTLASGSPSVTYQITAVRSTQRGIPAQFTVNFGVGGGGLTVESVTETPSGMKMAA